MRVLFIVQGEGRGHLTQALSLAQILKSAGHEVIGALVGITKERPVPAFFSEQFGAPIMPVFSPGLVYNAGTNELEPFKTTVQAIRFARPFWRSIQHVYDVIEEQRPDVVVNFYEMLGGLTYGLLRPSVPMVCIAHQYLSFHPNFLFPHRRWLDRLVFTVNSRLTSLGAKELLALSFDKQPDVPEERLRVIPPLLRQEVTQRKPSDGSFLLAYVTQPGLNVEILKAHHQHPNVRIEGFHAGVKVPDQPVDKTLTYHAIDGKRFLDFMERCTAIVTTAGFESVCEALYLGKPALMIPQPNHFEQACNALDGKRAGVGIASDHFELDHLLDYLPRHDASVSERFREWYAQGYYMFLGALNRAATTKNTSTGGFFWPRVSRLLRS